MKEAITIKRGDGKFRNWKLIFETRRGFYFLIPIKENLTFFKNYHSNYLSFNSNANMKPKHPNPRKLNSNYLSFNSKARGNWIRIIYHLIRINKWSGHGVEFVSVILFNKNEWSNHFVDGENFERKEKRKRCSCSIINLPTTR